MSASRPSRQRHALPEQLRAAGFTSLWLVVRGPEWQPGDVARILDWGPRGARLEVIDRAEVPKSTTAAAQIMRGEWVHVPWTEARGRQWRAVQVRGHLQPWPRRARPLSRHRGRTP